MCIQAKWLWNVSSSLLTDMCALGTLLQARRLAACEMRRAVKSSAAVREVQKWLDEDGLM